ncbi:MAG TPA: hypothetical protein VG870_09140 [Chitinophagaceae bacterium]|nr:hypothetical protein [Chitinophagaceae bacterium]
MIGVFKQKTPANILLLLLFGLLIKIPMFLHPHVPAAVPKDGLLFHWLLGQLQPAGNSAPVLYALLAFLLLYTQAVSLNSLINRNRMTQRLTYFPGMAYLLVTSLVPEWNHFSAPMVVNSLLILVLSWLFRTYNQPRAKGIIFNVGLAIGVMSFLYFPSLVFMIWAIFALMLLRPFRINEWLLCLLGITAPYYFYVIYLVLTDQWSLQKIVPGISIQVPRLTQSIWLAASAFFLCVPFLMGGYYVQDNLRRMLIQVRKGWSLILLYLLAGILIPFLNTTHSFENWIIVAVPFAAFHAAAYLYPSRLLYSRILFWSMTLFILAYQYYGPGW